MKAKRLVIDSNVGVPALISPTGTARQLVTAAIESLRLELFLDSHEQAPG